MFFLLLFFDNNRRLLHSKIEYNVAAICFLSYIYFFRAFLYFGVFVTSVGDVVFEFHFFVLVLWKFMYVFKFFLYTAYFFQIPLNILFFFSPPRRPLILHNICWLVFLPFPSFFIYSTTGAFRLYDVDNDGYITREEMYNIVDAIYQMVVCKVSFLRLYCVCVCCFFIFFFNYFV